MRRGLFERFQQCVECRRRQHVDLVDDVDFKAALCRRILAILTQIADLIDTVVGRTVNFDHIHAGPRHDRFADLGIVVRLNAGAALGVQCLREQTCGAGFTRATRAHKQIGMCNALALNGVTQRADNVVLPDQFIKLLGTPAARDNLITMFHRSTP